MKKRILILGAGPAGLACAAGLKRRGITDFIVLEKEATAGGLCRSATVDGGPLDIGGGHILDVRRPEVNAFLFSFLPETEWNVFDRKTKIRVGGHEIGYPFESNVWQLPEAEQVECIETIATAGCVRGDPMPERFTDWIHWKLGRKIAEMYMLPYNRKIFSENLDELGTYWLYKLPDVSFREVLLSCLRHAPFGTLPAHARFYYPKKYGYGEAFLRIAESLKDHVVYSTPVESLDWRTRTVNGTFAAETVVNTIPWREFASSLPDEVRADVAALRYSSVDIDYFSQGEETTDSHWTYCADPELSYHRLLHRNNFALGTRGYWTETNAVRAKAPGEFHYRNEYAYPLNTVDKPERIARLLAWGRAHGILGLGRWGEWEHMNSDVAVSRGLELAERI